MKINNTQPCNTPEKFQNAEQMWFWFLYSKSIQSDISRRNINPTHRPCELLDVESLITRLYLAGELTDEELLVMKKFGDRRRAPHQYIWAENRASQIWRNAMDTIGNAAKQRGWIE